MENTYDVWKIRPPIVNFFCFLLPISFLYLCVYVMTVVLVNKEFIYLSFQPVDVYCWITASPSDLIRLHPPSSHDHVFGPSYIASRWSVRGCYSTLCIKIKDTNYQFWSFYYKFTLVFLNTFRLPLGISQVFIRPDIARINAENPMRGSYKICRLLEFNSARLHKA